MKIESIRLKNYKVFRDVHLKDIPPFLVVVGANGSGKTTLFDVFGFLHDCLKGTVRQALDKRGRFREVLSRDADTDTILIEIQYRMLITNVERLVTYSLEIGEQNGSPIVRRELLRYKRGRYGSPFHFLDFSSGEGYAITNEEDFNKADEDLERETQKVAPDTLAIKGLGQFERFKAANAFRQLIESWHVSDFHISAARGRKEAAGDSEHLSETGDNLPRVAQYLFEQHPEAFQRILETMTRRVPGVASVEPLLMDDGYLTLRFQDGSFKTPFLGTMSCTVRKYISYFSSVMRASSCSSCCCCCTSGGMSGYRLPGFLSSSEPARRRLAQPPEQPHNTRLDIN